MGGDAWRDPCQKPMSSLQGVYKMYIYLFHHCSAGKPSRRDDIHRLIESAEPVTVALSTAHHMKRLRGHIHATLSPKSVLSPLTSLWVKRFLWHVASGGSEPAHSALWDFQEFCEQAVLTQPLSKPTLSKLLINYINTINIPNSPIPNSFTSFHYWISCCGWYRNCWACMWAMVPCFCAFLPNSTSNDIKSAIMGASMAYAINRGFISWFIVFLDLRMWGGKVNSV